MLTVQEEEFRGFSRPRVVFFFFVLLFRGLCAVLERRGSCLLEGAKMHIKTLLLQLHRPVIHPSRCIPIFSCVLFFSLSMSRVVYTSFGLPVLRASCLSGRLLFARDTAVS